MRRRSRRMLSSVTTLVCIIVILALVVLSPVGLREISVLPGLNWVELSNIGQTYGGVSALLSALALIGVSVSVLLQLREVRFSRLEARRTRHYELTRLAMEDPSYQKIFVFPEDPSIEVTRAFAYINQYLQFWQMLWEFSDISETELRVQARGLFNTSVGRDFWRRYGSIRLRNDNTRREREFDRVLDSIYKHQIASGPAVDASPSRQHSTTAVVESTISSKNIIGSAIIFAGGLTIGWLIQTTSRRSRP